MAKKTKKAAPKAPQGEAALTPGTVLRKQDRHGRAVECTTEAEGYSYAGQAYASLSGAAAAAAKDLGLKGTSFNGYVFWGLTRPGRATELDRLEHLWNRYSAAAVALLNSAEKDAAQERLRQHSAQMKAVAG
jgi:hypothetical protein